MQAVPSNTTFPVYSPPTEAFVNSLPGGETVPPDTTFPVYSPPTGVSVRNLPVSLFASVMGLSGLALAWRLAHSSLGVPAFIGEAIGAFALGIFVLIVLGYLVKLTRYRAAVQAEFNHPVAGNFFGTIAISILLLSAVVGPYSEMAARAIWTVGVLATFWLSFVVASRLLKGSVDDTHAVPAWLIPGVATLDIAVTGAHMPMAWAPEINLLAGAVGGVLALVLFVLIVRRLVHREPLAQGMTPSLMILVAPFAVGFLAYTNIVGGVDRFASVLFYFALFLFVVIAPKVFRRSIKFSPAWWAISFPMAALANAALKYADARGTGQLWMVAVLLLAVLSVALAVLTVRTVRIALNGNLLHA
ncbi:SLAC1 anion channel family protein [Variovorax paradoxus]|uniref:C4-dicarboxylate ABC transporter n=1 Tax=Variovorax paradoxus TaxID=34073 RepID=A0A6I6HL51_VARPD|nr:SLAC1 anion channel family protein [Variovorax paradoxus]QGW83646.1 C4-dicarboxylate ABC transporter [Variovorax paradoxus]